jgi:hypothetical protein
MRGRIQSNGARSDADRIEKQRPVETSVVEKDLIAAHSSSRVFEIEEDGVGRLRKSRDFRRPGGHQGARAECGSDDRLERNRNPVRQ